MSAASNVLRQLDAEKRLFGYRYHSDATIDAAFTSALAEAIALTGIDDIRNIGLYVGTEKRTAVVDTITHPSETDWYEPVFGTVDVPVARYFNKLTNAKLQGTALPDVFGEVCEARESQDYCQTFTVPPAEGPAPFTTVRGPDRWIAEISIAYTPGGFPYFLPKPYREQSSWQAFREALVFFFGVASFAIPGLGAAIGTYVFGAQIAAAYPALVAVATNAAFNAVLGGLDIEDAVKRAVASYAGAGIGDIVGAGLDSAVIGKLTGAATVAQLNGGDVQQAVAFAALQAGASGIMKPPASVPASLTTSEAPKMDDATPFDSVDMFPGSEYMFDVGTPAFASSFDASIFAGSGDTAYGASLADDGYGMNSAEFGTAGQPADPVYTGPGAGDYGVFNTGGGANLPPAAPSDGFDWDGVLATVSKAALTAIQINKAYQASGSPAPKVPQNSQVVNRNGTITTATPTGGRSTVNLPVGAPYLMADGSMVINNGDGTYSVTSPTGVTTKGNYAANASNVVGFPSLSAGGMDTSTMLMIAAAGVGALLLLRK